MLSRHFFDDFFDVSARSTGWTPRYDYQQGEAVDHLSVEMPGVSRSDLRMDVKGRILTIEAKRNTRQGEQTWKGQWVVSESVNTEAIEARLDSGILDITFPTSENGKSRSIEIQ